MLKNCKYMAVCLLAMLVSCTGKHENTKKELIPVKTIEVNIQESTHTKSYVGTAEEKKSTRVSCKYPGKLVSVSVRKGDYVKKGSTLAVISSQSVLTTKEIADATLRQARDGYERIQKLHEAGTVPDVKLVEIETQLAKAEAAAEAADKSLEECTLKAPFSGVIGAVYAEEGVELNLLQDVVQILDLSEIEIHFSVPENEISQITKGQDSEVSIPALGIVKAPGTITHKGIDATILSHTYQCTLKLDEPVHGLMPGMVCKVYLDKSQGDAAVVPASAIRTDAEGRYVWTVRDQIVAKKYIRCDGFANQGVIVREGLENGERIVTEGVQKICTGMKVRVIE